MDVLVEPQASTNMECQMEVVPIHQELPVISADDREKRDNVTEVDKKAETELPNAAPLSLFVLIESTPSSDDKPADSERPFASGEGPQGASNNIGGSDATTTSNDGDVGSDSALSSSSVPSASNSPIITMACVVCGTTIEMPSYAALTRKCFMKCSKCNPEESHAKNWLDIILTALYNLEVLHKRKYFHCKNEICTFIDRHWNDICPERARTPTWGNTIMSQISTHPELFISHQRGSGYWALKRKHFRMKKAEAKGRSIVDQDGSSEQPGTKKRDQDSMAGEEGSKEFLVESIIGKRIVGGKVEYLLKWEGFNNTENSWETAADLNCPELIQEFETRAQCPALWKNNPRRKRKSTEALGDTPEKEGEKGNEQKNFPLGMSAHANKRQRARVRMIPPSQSCHQCKERKPVIVFCNRCENKYCEHCLEKFYDEDILEIQRNRKVEWLCPGCRGFCSCPDCCAERGEPYVPRRKPRERVISRIIARCKQEGSKEWEYLVHFKGCSSAKNTWIVSRSEVPPDLLRKYKNSLKLRINKNKELPEQKNKKRPSSGKIQKRFGQGKDSKRSGSSNNLGGLRSPGLNKRGLRTSDFDITRVIFEDPSPKIVLPKRQEVLTPAWRVIQDITSPSAPKPSTDIPSPRGRRVRPTTPTPQETSITTKTETTTVVQTESNDNSSLTSLFVQLDKTCQELTASSQQALMTQQQPPEGPANIFRALPPSAVPMGLPPPFIGASATAQTPSPSSESTELQPENKVEREQPKTLENKQEDEDCEETFDESLGTRLVALRSVELDEGSSSEDTSDEAYRQRHARYETKLPLLLEIPEPPPKKPTTPRAPKKATPNRRNKGGNIRDSGESLQITEITTTTTTTTTTPSSATPTKQSGKKRKSEKKDKKTPSKPKRRKSEESMGMATTLGTNNNNGEKKEQPEPKATQYRSRASQEKQRQLQQQRPQQPQPSQLPQPPLLREGETNQLGTLSSPSLLSAYDTHSYKPGLATSYTPLLDSVNSTSPFSGSSYLSPLPPTTPTAQQPQQPPQQPQPLFSPSPSPVVASAPPPPRCNSPVVAQYGVAPPAPPKRNSRRMSTGGTGTGLPYMAAQQPQPQPQPSSSFAHKQHQQQHQQHQQQQHQQHSLLSHGPPSANAFYAPPPSAQQQYQQQASSMQMYAAQQSFGNSFSPVIGGNGMMPPPVTPGSTPYVSLSNNSAPYNQFS